VRILILFTMIVLMNSCTLVLYDGSKHNDRCDCPPLTPEESAAEANDRQVIRDALDNILSGDGDGTE
jgi:hypothetical protein